MYYITRKSSGWIVAFLLIIHSISALPFRALLHSRDTRQPSAGNSEVNNPLNIPNCIFDSLDFNKKYNF